MDYLEKIKSICWNLMLAGTKFKPWQYGTVDMLTKRVRNKNVVLIGNSPTVFNSKKDIDKYDFVIRCNRAFPFKYEEYIGSKTNMIFTSYNILPAELQKLDYPLLVWCYRQDRMTRYMKSISFLLEWRKTVTTGVRAIQALMCTDFKTLTIYGFDFHKTGCWWHSRQDSAPHDMPWEEDYVRNLAKTNDRIRLVIE